MKLNFTINLDPPAGGASNPPSHASAGKPLRRASEAYISAVMKDGTLYAGLSPHTGKPMYTTAYDAPFTYTFDEAKKYAKALNRQKAHGNRDWRVPTMSELNVLFNNRAAIGSFKAKWYWSNTPGLFKWYACGRRFLAGDRSDIIAKGDHLRLRCVR